MSGSYFSQKFCLDLCLSPQSRVTPNSYTPQHLAQAEPVDCMFQFLDPKEYLHSDQWRTDGCHNFRKTPKYKVDRSLRFVHTFWGPANKLELRSWNLRNASKCSTRQNLAVCAVANTNSVRIDFCFVFQNTAMATPINFH